MRIDGLNGSELMNLPGGKGKSDKTKTPAPKAMAVDNGHEHISSQKSLIQAALAANDVNSKAVAEARVLLESGQLDTPESIKRAAQNIINIGF